MLPGLCVSGFVTALAALGLIQLIENVARDQLIRLRGEQPWNDGIVLVDIDRQTLVEYGQIGQLRPYYAELIDLLIKSDNQVVAFDILMFEDTDDDSVLAEAMARHQGVILASHIDYLSGQLQQAPLPIRRNARSSGHINDYSDARDGTTRSHLLHHHKSSSLVAEIARAYDATTDVLEVPDQPELLINWPDVIRKNGLPTLPVRSLLDVLEGRVPTDDFKNKIVIVGSTAVGTDNWTRTPFDWKEPIPGIYSHVAALHTLLEGNWLRTLNPQAMTVGLLIFGPLVSAGLQGLSFLRQVGIWVMGSGGWLIICWGAIHFNYALPVAAPLIVFGLTESFIIFTDRLRSSAMLQARNEFLGTMSHELRTPLNGIIGVAEMIQETPLNPKQREFSETIQNSSQALLALINDVLDFSKIESGKLVLEEHQVNVRHSLEESLDIVATRAAHQPLELVSMVDPAVPSVVISDPVRLRQILLNLLSNAVKFTNEGEVAVVVERAPEQQEGQASARWSHPAEQWVRLRFAVRDTGIGIPGNRLATIFEPFHQASSSTTRKYGGTGLGLTISKRLAETMGGHLWVESEVGRGSTFFFTISAQLDPTIGQMERPAALVFWANRRMLVIEENTTRRRSLEWQLQSLDIEVLCSPSVADALLHIQQGQQFDGVILDSAIAKLDWMSTLESLRTALDAPQLPSIVLASLRDKLEPTNRADLAIVWKPIKQASLHRALVQIHPDQGLNNPGTNHHTNETVPQPSALGAEDQTMGLRVLIADDNPVNQRVAQHMLQMLGHRTDTVATGEEAIEAIEQDRYDVVLMDMRMPQMDGVEATQRIRQMGQKIAQPWIVAMTANANSEDRDHCLAMGMNDYLSKPIRRDRLSRIFTNIDQGPKN